MTMTIFAPKGMLIFQSKPRPGFEPRPVYPRPAALKPGRDYRPLVVVAGCVGLVAVYQLSRAPWRKILDRLRDSLLKKILSFTQQPSDSSPWRNALTSVPEPRLTKSRAHSHPESAQSRSKATAMINYIAQEMGVQPFFYQRSRADERNGRLGSRQYYWAKDLTASPSPLPLKPELLAIVDVDYYMDMPDFLADYFCPVIMYTLVPSRAAKSQGEYSYTFDVDSSIKYDIAGGAKYSHKLWSYANDTVTTYRGIFQSRSHVYQVDRRQIDDDHQLILLTPIARFSCPLMSLNWFIHAPALDRLNVIDVVKVNGVSTPFVRIDRQTEDGRRRSTGKPGMYVCADTEAADDDALALQSQLGKTELTIAQAKVTTQCDATSSAAVLTQYHRAKQPTPPSVVYPIAHSFKSFMFSPDTYDPSTKDSIQAFMAPLALGTYAPKVCQSNDTQAIVGRIEQVRPTDLELTGEMIGYMEEFVKLLVPNAHLGHPVDHDEVYERQSRPSQRRHLDDAGLQGGISSDKPKSFMKREPYAKPTDPRNITTIPAPNKLMYSTYIYAFSNLMRTTKWYAFGKTPKEIAQRVADICSGAQEIVKTDLSRCDGRISFIFRHLEKMLMLRYFDESYHDQLVEIMRTQFQQRCVTATGYKYDSGDSRLSGSPETADFNSVDNAFMAYITYRRMGISTYEAYMQLGLYGGDDGLTSDINVLLYTKAAAETGQLLEAEVVRRHESGVDFLARMYSSHVWTGALDSMCDFTRQIIKLHVTVTLPSNITPLMKLAEKLRGYKATDSNTPVFSSLVRSYERRYGPLTKSENPEMRGVAGYYSDYSESDQYPNINVDGWMDDFVATQCPDFDRAKFENWVTLVSHGEADILSPPLCREDTKIHKVPADCVVDDDVVKAEKKVIEPCAHYLQGRCNYGSKCSKPHPGNVPQQKPRCQNFYKSGECKFGKSCKFTHEKPAARSSERR